MFGRELARLNKRAAAIEKRIPPGPRPPRKPARQAAPLPHTQDSDCKVRKGRCVACKAEHDGPSCDLCGRRAYHAPGCPEFVGEDAS